MINFILGISITLNLITISALIVYFNLKKYKGKEVSKFVENENDFKYFFGGKL